MPCYFRCWSLEAVFKKEDSILTTLNDPELIIVQEWRHYGFVRGCMLLSLQSRQTYWWSFHYCKAPNDGVKYGRPLVNCVKSQVSVILVIVSSTADFLWLCQHSVEISGFSVKSILAAFRRSKTAILTILEALLFLRKFTLETVKN